MPSYLFSAGNSSRGPIGFCARVTAASESEAVSKLREHLVSINQEYSLAIAGQPAIEYVEVYFNADALDQADIDEGADVFRLANEERDPAPAPVFEPLPQGRQKPLLRGLQDSPGQLNLFPGMDVA